MNSCFNSCCNCNCSKDHYYIGPTGCTGTIGPNGATCSQSIQGIQAEITGQQDTSNVRVSDVHLLIKNISRLVTKTQKIKAYHL